MNNTRRLIVVVFGPLLALTRPTTAIPAAQRKLDGAADVCGEEQWEPDCMDSDSWEQCADIRDFSGCDNMLVTSCPRRFACLEWDTCSKQDSEECQSIVDGGCYAVVMTTGGDGTETFGCGDPERPDVTIEDAQPAPANDPGGGLGDGGDGGGNGDGVRPSVTEDQCKNSGGVAFYDPGDGNTRKAGYVCDDTKRPPMADISGTNGWKGAVCCPVPGSQGQVEEPDDPASPVNDNDNGPQEDEADQVNEAAEEEPVDDPQQPSDTPQDVEDDPQATDTEEVDDELAPLASMTEDECKNSGGVAFYDPGDGSTHIRGYVCDDTRLIPLGAVSGTGADEGAICCPVPGAGATNDYIDDTTVTTTLCSDGDCDDNDQGVIERAGERPQLTRDECTAAGGETVTDPGDASTRREDYVCTNGSGQPPTANIRYDVGDPIPREGEVCCPLPTIEVGDVIPSMANDDECGAAGGWVYVDATIDITTIDRSNFLCPPSGMPGETGHPPIGSVQSRENAVCCPLNVSGGNERKSIPREECVGTGGEVVFPDSADGGLCPATGEPPVANIENSATGEVCCMTEDEGSLPADRPNVGSREDCAALGGEYYVDPGDGSSGRRDFVCPGTGGLPPIGDIQSGAMEGEVCCPVSEEIASDRPSIETRESCTEMGGDYYVDPGDGSTLLQSFVCPNGEQPIGDIQQTGGMEGEVCCPIVGEAVVDVDPPPFPDTTEVERPTLTRSECEATAGGGMYHVYGDPGDGSTRRAGFVCPDTTDGPIANIRYDADEPIAAEGEVCCPLPITMSPDDQHTMVTLVECDEADGRVVALGVDATMGTGNGSDVSDLLCPDGQTPLGVIRYEVGEQITVEGEICCVADDREGASGALSDSPAAVFARGGSSPLVLMVGALFIAAPHLA